MEKSIKWKWSSGLFWEGGAAERKKNPIAISMQIFGVVSSTICGQIFYSKFYKNILVSALKSYIIKSYETNRQVYKKVIMNQK